MAEFKDIIKKLRSEKNWSQAMLAEELNAGVSTVASWEVGKRLPGRPNMEQLSDIFNVDIDYLYGKTDIRQKIHFDNDGNKMIQESFLLSDLEHEIIIEYRKADKIGKASVLRILGIDEKGENSKMA